jgi:transmembrane sensor
MDAGERRARVSAEAAEWWLQLQSPEMSRSEREQFVRWLRESAVHVAEMLRIARVHNALAQFERWGSISTAGSGEETVVEFPQERATPAQGSGRGGRPHRRIVVVGALATSLLGIAALTLFLPSLSGRTLETERGERREVTLSDGSMLELDPQTKLRVKFAEQTRRIVLERGRALFRVEKDPHRPFIVETDGTTVRAVGTAFAVDHYQQDIVVTVAEGRVLVAPLSRLAALSEPSQSASREGSNAASRDPGPISLSANQQLTLGRKGALEAVRKVDSHRELAWTKGRLVLDNVTVAAAIAALNRYNRVQLRVADEVLAARRVSGVFDTSDPESFLAFVQTVVAVKVLRATDHDIIIASVD